MGIELLKMLMCFDVVLNHYWNISSDEWMIQNLLTVAVPTFMFISFFFSTNYFLSHNNSVIKKRFWRIIYPHIGWSFIYWFFYFMLYIIIGYDISVGDLLCQLATGHCINPPMWFQTNLAVLTLIFFISFKFANGTKGLLILYPLAIFSFWFQYSGYNLQLFGPLKYELRYPLGRLFEMIPYAVFGFSVAHFNLFHRLKIDRFFLLVLFGLLTVVSFFFKLIPSAPGFGYSDNNHLLFVFFIVGFAYHLPLDKLSEKTKHIIFFITKYTLGIYCMHSLIGKILNNSLTFIGIKMPSFVLCIVIYIIAFCISLTLCKISSKYLKQLVE